MSVDMPPIHPRVRFAPSPTGELHIGGLRTALYNYLFAKRQGGDFILRIEDTDQTRFVEGAAERLIGVLEGMGVRYTEGVFVEDGTSVQKGDFGPYIQSERLKLYRKYAEELVVKKKAYYCFCTADRLAVMREEQARNKQAPKYDKRCLSLSDAEIAKRKDAGEPFVIRFNVPIERGDICFRDLIRGEVRFHAKDIDDQVLMKSDGFPTYHLAVVVDDHLMKITHVLRSEEWLPSTPKHILLYEAFGWELPMIGHVSFILGKDGKKKLSKREGGVSVEYFQSAGYLNEAIINFIALLGWNPGKGNTQEIFSLEEMEELFDISGLHKAGAVFDRKKLDWVNGEYIKRMSIDELYRRSFPFLETKPFVDEWRERSSLSEGEQIDFLKRVLTIEQDRLTKLSDVVDQSRFFFGTEPEYEKTMLRWKDQSDEVTKDSLEKSLAVLSDQDDAVWSDHAALEKTLLEAAGEKRGDLLWPLRVALTGAERSPSPFDCAWVLGKDATLSRIRIAIDRLSGSA